MVTQRLAVRELQPKTDKNYVDERTKGGVIGDLRKMDEQNALIELPKNVSEMVEYSPDIKVLEFEVFHDYLAIL